MRIKTSAARTILFFAFFMGCSGNYGKISKQTGNGNKMSPEKFRKNVDEYQIYVATRSGRRASAIMFDPKNNDKQLVSDSWIEIKDSKTLDEKIEAIQTKDKYASVPIIMGPNLHVFGYMVYPTYLKIPEKAVDDRTLYVSALPP